MKKVEGVNKNLLKVLTDANSSLLTVNDEEKAIKRTLKILAEFAGADRAYLFKNFYDVESKKDFCSHLIEWHNPNVESQSNNPLLKKFFYENQKMEWLLDDLSKGKTVVGNKYDFPKENQELFQRHQVQSLLIQPIFIQQKFWGFIGCDACIAERSWSEELTIILESIGTSLAIYYDKYELKKEFNNQNEYFKTILENVNEGISVLDENGKIVYQSPSNPQVVGYSNDESKEINYFSLIHPEDVSKAEELYQKIYLDFGKLYKTVVRYMHSEGHYIKMELEAINLLKNDIIKGVVINFRDVSASETYKERLEQKQQILNAAQVLVKAGSYEIDVKANSIHVSDQLYVIHGLNRNDIINEQLYYQELIELVHPDDKEFVKKETEEGILSDKGFNIEYRIITKTGELKYLFSKAEVFLDESLQLWKIIGTVQDVTERKLQEEKIKQISQDLTKKNQELETFAYVTSHNLRSPIANLIGLCTLIEQDQLTNKNLAIFDKFKHLLNQLSNSLSDIVDSINRINDDYSNIEFINTFNEVALEIDNLIEESGAEISLDFSKAPSIIYPKSHLHNIFMNMLTNAIKYRNPDKELLIHIESSVEDEFKVISFTDNGMGIDLKKHSKKLFEKYERLDAGKSTIEGKGLGLHIIKQQLDQHNGHIKVNSKLGEGTTFKIYLNPLMDNE